MASKCLLLASMTAFIRLLLLQKGFLLIQSPREIGCFILAASISVLTFLLVLCFKISSPRSILVFSMVIFFDSRLWKDMRLDELQVVKDLYLLFIRPGRRLITIYARWHEMLLLGWWSLWVLSFLRSIHCRGFITTALIVIIVWLDTNRENLHAVEYLIEVCSLRASHLIVVRLVFFIR